MVERATRAIESREERERRTGEVLLMNGVDHVEPHPVIPELVRAAGRQRSARRCGTPRCRPMSTPCAPRSTNGVGRVARSRRRRAARRRGLRQPAARRVLGARLHQAGQRARADAARKARGAAGHVRLACSARATRPRELGYAWKTLLQNHPHDSICGCSIDAVHEENMTRFARAEQVARAVVDEAAGVIARGVPAGPARCAASGRGQHDGHAVSRRPRGDASICHMRTLNRGAPDPEALDAPVALWPADASITGVRASIGAALATPFQVLAQDDVVTFVMSRYDTPWALRARRFKLLFAGEVPACGYTCVRRGRSPTPTLAAVRSEPARPATERRGNRSPTARRRTNTSASRVNDDGTVDVVDLRSGTRYPRCGELEDVGDVGDEYNYSPPQRGDRRITSARRARTSASRTSRTVRFAPSSASISRCRLPVSVTGDRTARSDGNRRQRW